MGEVDPLPVDVQNQIWVSFLGDLPKWSFPLGFPVKPYQKKGGPSKPSGSSKPCDRPAAEATEEVRSKVSETRKGWKKRLVEIHQGNEAVENHGGRGGKGG